MRDDLVDACIPGDIVTLTGIVKVRFLRKNFAPSYASQRSLHVCRDRLVKQSLLSVQVIAFSRIFWT